MAYEITGSQARCGSNSRNKHCFVNNQSRDTKIKERPKTRQKDSVANKGRILSHTHTPIVVAREISQKLQQKEGKPVK